MKRPHHQNVIAWVLVLIFIVLAAGLAAALAMVFAPVRLTLEENRYSLTFLFHEEGAQYADLEEVSLLDDAYSSERVKSYGGISKEYGTYKNQDYGEHFRLTFSENKHNYILLKRKDGSVTVFNQKTEKATSSLYEELLAKLS